MLSTGGATSNFCQAHTLTIVDGWVFFGEGSLFFLLQNGASNGSVSTSRTLRYGKRMVFMREKKEVNMLNFARVYRTYLRGYKFYRP